MSRTRLISILLTSVLVVAILLAGKLWLLAYLEGKHEERVPHGQIRHELLRLERLVADADMAFLGYVLTRQANFLEPMTAAERQVPAVLDHLASLSAPWPEFRGRVFILAPRVVEFLALKRQFTKQIDDGLEEGVRDYIRTGDGAALAKTIDLAIEDLDRRLEEQERSGDEERRERRARVRTGLIATTLGTLAAGVSLGRVRGHPTGRVKEVTVSPYPNT